MLFTIDRKQISAVPHESQFNAWMRNLDPVDHQRIFDKITALFDKEKVQTSSYIPGSDWDGTIYEPLWHACGGSDQQAGFFFGLIVWQVAMNHSECWSFGKYVEDIQGTTYFRIDRP